MNDFSIVAKGDIVLVTTKRDLKFPVHIQNEIDKIWNELKERNSFLFDSQSPVVLNIEKKQKQAMIKVTFVNYRTILADRKNPDLGIGVFQIGVSGIILLNDNKVVFAKRSDSTTEYPGKIELVPSGNIDMTDVKEGKVDYISKLKKEFEEETGISKNSIKEIEPLCLVKDNKNQIYDVCCKLQIDKNEYEFLDLFSNNSEYKKPLVIKVDELYSFYINNNKKIIPTSKALVTYFTSNFR